MHCFPHLEACNAPSGTMEASTPRRLKGLMSEVHGVFINTDLPSTPGRKARAAATAYTMFWESLGLP